MLKRHFAGDFASPFADFTVSLLIAMFLLILFPFIPLLLMAAISRHTALKGTITSADPNGADDLNNA